MSGNVRDELQELVEWADKYPHAVEYGRIGVHVEKLRRAVTEMDRLTAAVGDAEHQAQAVVSVVSAHNTVDTVEALDALPVGTVVRDDHGYVWVRRVKDRIGWASDDGTDSYFGAKYIDLPARVLFRPDGGGE